MAEKAVTYTAEQTAEIVQSYKAGETAEAIAQRIGKSVRSVIAKLSREGVYVAKSKAAGTGRVTKANLVSKLEALTGVAEGTFATFEKASHEALEAMVKAVEAV